MPATLNDTFTIGDTIRVLAYSRAAILLPDETVLRLDQNTTVTFTEPQDENRTWLELIRGVIHVISRFPQAVKVITPFANAGLEGTEFSVRVTGDETVVTVYEGEVSVSTETGDVNALSGQYVVARTGQQLTAQIVVRPQDAVQWTFYYTPILGYELPAADHEADAEQVSDTLFYTGRAAQRLAVGRVDEAEVDIARALDLDSSNVDAVALRSIIAVTQNDKDSALALAQQAVAQNPQSATALIALSYAQQAHFDLSGALGSLQVAVDREPSNVLAWARQSELWLVFGDLDQSLNAAQTAVSLDPNLAHTQTVLGFAYLSQIDTTQAVAAFEKAIALDQAAPLPRLGLGLALIRQGELSAGRAEIEIAVILDPGNALIRSYMGKAYYEEKRDDLAESQLGIAKALDPRDPTPWFYDAIRKQTINRPIEALQDLQQSIELNDNRAIYRSRLLLDQDLAARSASQARIYNDLGFQQLALAEGWKSIDSDPGNYSAHRLLADLYAVLPRHDIARESELLQSQLRQPLNINPAQSQINDIGSFVLQGTGPRDPSFNEFTPLFMSDRFALQANGVVGSNGLLGDEIVASGVFNKVSFSLSQYYFETDGFRDNQDQEQTLFSAFVQAELNPKTNVQAEISVTEIDRGDLNLLFDPENFLPSLREKIDDQVVRLGLHHSIATNSDVIASIWHQDRKFDLNVGGSDDTDSMLDGLQTEIQHLFKHGRLNLTSGIGHFDGKREDTEFFGSSSETFTDDIRHINLYVYSLLNLADNLVLTLGASADSVDSDFVDEDQVNPKIGLNWNVTPTTTLRFAAFRTFQRTLISDQTIEPTTIAGFNQFFDDGEGADATRFGVGLDHRFNRYWYGGVELSKRYLEIPGEKFDAGVFVVDEGDLDEEFDRAYLYWTPDPAWALIMELQREESKREEDFVGPEEIRNLTTQRVLLGVSYFHPSGVKAQLMSTYVDQDGTFGSGFGTFEDDGDHFDVVDLALSYRLPKRRGLVTIGVKNLFDEEFEFQDTDPANPRLLPDRFSFARINLAF